MGSGCGGAADAAARERPQFQPLLGDLRAARDAAAVGAGVDPGQRGIDVADGDLQVGAPALRDRVGDGLGALGQRVLALPDAVGALVAAAGRGNERWCRCWRTWGSPRGNAGRRGHRGWRVREAGRRTRRRSRGVPRRRAGPGCGGGRRVQSQAASAAIHRPARAACRRRGLRAAIRRARRQDERRNVGTSISCHAAYTTIAPSAGCRERRTSTGRRKRNCHVAFGRVIALVQFVRPLQRVHRDGAAAARDGTARG